MLPKRVRQTIEAHSLIQAGDRILVAYSGGPDSTALLVLLAQMYSHVSAVYVNHQLRGRESEEEERFVRSFCRERKIPLFVEKIHWKRKPGDLENAARKRRYRHLAKVAKEHGYHKVALAHHKDDAVETFLLNLMRGSGPSGLTGIPFQRSIYIRPMLNCTRDEIRQYLKKHRILSFEDTSNQATMFQRNKVRHVLIPLIEREFNPRFSEAVYRTSRWMTELNHLLETLLMPYSLLMKQESPFLWQLDRSEWMKMDHALKKAFLKRVIRKMDPSARLSAANLSVLLNSLDNQQPADLPGLLSVHHSHHQIQFRIKRQRIGVVEVDVPAPGDYTFPPSEAHLSFSLRNRRGQAPIPSNKNVAYLDARKASFPLYIRNWKKGDAFRPLGMTGHKKLSDYWIDKKVPREERKRIPLVFKDDELIWAAGHQIHHDYRVTDNTKTLLRIEVRKSV